MAEVDRAFTPEDLAQCDGKEGRPMYVAYRGVVYDVSKSKLWRTGMHMRKHSPGQDLTREMAEAPHGEEVFARVARVGVLTGYTPPEEAVAAQYDHLPGPLASLMRRVPFLERHPHPMTVHFPIAFNLAAPVFALLYLATGIRAFELTSANTLAAGVFFTLLAMLTGLLTWWVNYEADPIKPVITKIVFSCLMFVDGLAALIWRVLEPDILVRMVPARYIYLTLLLFFLPAIGVIGWYGATLTFPLREPHHLRK
jgi:predicted heme/steroid binding protein/uncharacterized membrane protein